MLRGGEGGEGVDVRLKKWPTRQARRSDRGTERPSVRRKFG
jgi:hypothetical protein